MSRQKRVAAVHDISCFGKCSLTVALPILSAAGIETSVIPTAVLSTHTGGFEGYTCRDLSDDILPIVSHWERLGLAFDAIYTGFLGSYRQTGIVSEMFDRLAGPSTLVVVDPVMADHGKLYPVYDDDFPEGMKRLCAKADLVVPNITEACLLTGEPYHPGPYDAAFIERLLDGLSALGPKQVVLTGVCLRDGHLGAASHITGKKTVDYAFSHRIEDDYHGTGDVFTSVLTAALLTGRDLQRATEIAVDFTVRSIERTRAQSADVRYGVNFEAGLGALAAQLCPGDSR